MQNFLQKQRKSVRWAILDFFFCALLFFVLVSIVVIIGVTEKDNPEHARGMLYGAAPILAAFGIAFLIYSLHYLPAFLVHRKASHYKTKTVAATPIKIRFIYKLVSRNNTHIIGMKLRLESGEELKKFYYIFPHSIQNSYKTELKELLCGELQITCYSGTNAIVCIDKIRENKHLRLVTEGLEVNEWALSAKSDKR